MKPKQLLSYFRFSTFFISALLMAISQASHAQTFWTGPSIIYTQPGPDDADVILTNGTGDPVVSFTRDSSGLPYNPAAGETFSDFISSPADTEWGFGTIDQVMADTNSIAFMAFPDLRNMANDDSEHLAQLLPNVPMVLHLINEDIYISLTFTNWTQGFHSGSGFGYIRSTAAAALPPPTVSILSPTNNTILAGPAKVKLSASASQTGGSVSSVEYFAATASSTNSLGSATTSPFNVTNTLSTAGNYAITAVATASGASATSTAVNISVVTPVAVNLSSTQIASNKFVLKYSANPGLNYVVQSSTNVNGPWTPLATNLAGSNPVSFTNGFSAATPRTFYRVGRLPNP